MRLASCTSFTEFVICETRLPPCSSSGSCHSSEKQRGRPASCTANVLQSRPHFGSQLSPIHRERHLSVQRRSSRRYFATASDASSDLAALEDILQRVARGETAPGDAALRLMEGEASRALGDSDMTVRLGDFAQLDTQRKARTGFPEVVWGPGKTPEQIAEIMRVFAAEGQVTMATRITPQVYEEIRHLYPAIRYHATARICTLEASADANNKEAALQAPMQGQVVILCAGTSDLPVAEEARLTAQLMGCTVDFVADVGVAGIHRLLAQLPRIREADVVIVVAGMDGALPSVAAGLVEVPVIAVPTSIGYGAAFNGVAPLLSALNACSPGVAVVNIDNGFGAAMLAARMLQMASRFNLTP
ncbi:hypothetical protein CYMTET_5173 [Cymbomonas tetramitiformis]|uniref:phosphoribosylaminoimidazole carboxylase n=1 Tax=Cymbomonas tetramitiformis TaxID=36881 RepID=A0AAE0GZM8_9CHLO|nr:hypothetical protein CYMTET_5173 [Cymbomonas tetramitiformis]